ncbi:MAG: UDP-N-acetylglucosamine 1-carboxyvinyltransferase [Ruminococcaceae bacterium]|nr:UDP-N-acetylglucosamine 1-carboxyvinyltransferase [Oscillospiraceae bacterium]
MAKLVITGGRKLSGEVKVQGSKNSSLPILAATILCEDESVLYNCPDLKDVDATVKILRYLGCKASRHDTTLVVDTSTMTRSDIPHDLMREMRSSIIFLGAITARCGKAKMSLPGGCELGPRPIDLHLSALRQMGIEINEQHGELECVAVDGIKPSKIALSFPSVGATENIMLTAVKASGTTIITNAAKEPEIVDLADYLNACGAKISGAGESTIIIEGVDKLHGCNHSIIADRIVAATLMSAAAATSSKITLDGVVYSHLSMITPIFEQAGCEITQKMGKLTLDAPYRLRSPKLIRTMPYPGFPTDAQAPVMAMTCKTNGLTVFVENIFESRYKHVDELNRLGANIKVEGKVALVDGVRHLSGASVRALDLRGAAALVVAALSANGHTQVCGIKYLERGYDEFEVVLQSLGADIKKI